MILPQSVPRASGFTALLAGTVFFTRQKASIPATWFSCILAILALTLCPQYGRASGDTIVYGISMPVPDGYAEIRREDFPEFYNAMALESYFAYDDLARFFVLESEIPLLREGNLDALSATATAVIFKPQNRKKADLLLGKLAELAELPYSELDAPQKLMYPLMPMSYYWGIGHTEQQSGMPEAKHMEQWFEIKPNGREPFMTGLIARESGFGIGAWLQERNDHQSYGLIGAGPQCMTFAFTDRGEERIGLLFANKAGSPEAALTSIAFVQTYLRKSGDAIVLKKTAPQAREGTGLQILYYAGMEWKKNKNYAKAADAFSRSILVADTFNLAVRKFAAVNELGKSLINLDRTQEVLDRFPAFLDDCTRQLGPDSPLTIRMRGLLGMARQMRGQMRDAVSDYKKALEDSLQAFGPLNWLSIDLEYLLADAYKEQGCFSKSRTLYKEILNAITESREPKHACTLWIKLSQVERGLHNTKLASFYEKIATGIMWYTDMTASFLREGSSLEKWELEPFFSQNDALSSLRIPDEVRTVYNRPNRAMDTPWNKARDMMKAHEVNLYARFGHVALNLRNAGKFGTEEEKEQARAEFHNWLTEVETTLR